ncbi:MAG: hypothetical protein JNK29_03170 [Anaerolineales bacterium]|nr:hypothetical protein [Anaerolineales bacterium]
MQTQNARGWLGGIALILAGLLFLAQNLNWLGPWSPQIWMYVFAGASGLFFINYVVGGVREWGWLFPATCLGGVALTLGLVQAGVDEPILGAPVLVGVAVPFLVAFALDRQRWGVLIPAWILIAIALIVSFAERVSGELIGGLVLWAIALPFLVVYLRNRAHWWALIPGLLMATLGTLVPLEDLVGGAWIGSFVLLALALPFLAVYLHDRSRWWALIPAFILAAIGVLIPLIERAQGVWVDAFVMGAIALPFLVVYLVSARNWWAIIPAGILLTIGLVIGFTGATNFDLNGMARLNGLLFLGWAVTFAILWLRPSGEQRHTWARYPALGLAAAAGLALVLGANFDLLWPVLLIGAGLIALWSAFRPGRGTPLSR